MTAHLEQARVTAQDRVEEIINEFFREHRKQKERWEQKAPYMR